MKTLKDILYRAPILEMVGNPSLQVSGVTADSRKVTENSCFVAVRGVQTDGHLYIQQAIERGASVIVGETSSIEKPANVTYVRVADSAETLSYMVANWFDNPADRLTMVGVTGTNGKTTVATLLYDLFTKLGYKCGLVSTVVIRVADVAYNAMMTTPDPEQLHRYFAKMRDAGCTFCFMEVSSHALDQRRVAGIKFRVGIFTNLTHDHLDYHETFENYRDAKQELFNHLSPRSVAVTNVDDPNGKFMVQNTEARVVTYGLRNPADYKTRIIEQQMEGMMLDLFGVETWFQLTGQFNALNMIAVLATAMELGLDKDRVLLAASALKSVNGRFHIFQFGRHISAVVDYAHTPDALKNVLETLDELRPAQGRLITVIGCGGNRDVAKRPIMATLAVEFSDLVILTSDNPRDEDPNEIINQMLEGVTHTSRKKVLTIENRKDAIQTAARFAQSNDVILVAGKGHETYQEIKGQRFHFDDKEELINAFIVIEN